MGRKETNQRAKIFAYNSTFIVTVTYGCEFWHWLTSIRTVYRLKT